MSIYPAPEINKSRIWNGLKVGVLGGSFNPAHDGHKHISDLALKHLGLDCVWWLVSPQNPLKSTEGMAPFEERFQSAMDVIGHTPNMLASDLERQIGGQYTSHTLTTLHMHFPQTRFVWLMGTDNFRQVHLWEDWTDIFASTPVAVFARPPKGSSLVSCPAALTYRKDRVTGRGIKTLAEQKTPAWVLLHSKLNPLSSTQIRAQYSNCYPPT